MPEIAAVTPFPTPQAQDFDELGVTLNLPFGTWMNEVPNPEESSIPDLLERLENIQRTDGHARALYRLLTLPLRLTGWSLQPAEGGDKEAEFLELMLSRPPHEGGMTVSFDQVRARMSKAVVTGYQPFEKVYGLADVPGFGESIVLRKLAPRDPSTVTFKADDNGGFDGLVQRAYKRDVGYVEVEIPPAKSFFFTVDKEDHPFYGRSMFLPSLYHFDKKHKLYYIAHIAMQFAAVPGRLGYMDDDDLPPSKKAAFRQALASFGFNTAMLVPRGTRVEPFQGSSGVGKEIVELINHHNIQASQSVLAQFIDLSVSTGTGTRSLSEDMSGLFLMTLESILNSMAEHLNAYVFPQFVDWNFGTARYPTLSFDPISDEMRNAMHEVFKVIATAKSVHVTPDFVYELEKRVADELGVPVDYEELDRKREEQEGMGPDILATIEKALGGGGDQGPPGPGSQGSEDDEDGDVQLSESAYQRERLAQFAEVNEVGSGAGIEARGTEALAPIVSDIQSRLIALGYAVSDDAGEYGRGTSKAVKAFQEDNGLPQTGRVDLSAYALLLEETPEVRPR